MSCTFGPYNPFKHNSESGGWSALTQAYKANPSIELYVGLRRKYPKMLIEVATSASMDWLLANGELLESYGIDPQIVAGCLDACPDNIEELSLLLMENIVLRRKLEAKGETHVQSRAEIISDGLANYLTSMMLDALDWNDDLEIPRDLIVLIKHQFNADVSAEKRKFEVYEKRSQAKWMAGQLRAQGVSFSMRDVAKEMGVNPSTVARWFPDGSFEEEVEQIRELASSDMHKDMMEFGRKFREGKNKTD